MLRAQLVIPLLVLSIIPLPTAAATRQVPSGFPTIQAAIDVSTFGDVIEVAPGTYPEQLVIGPSQNGITVRGLFGATATTIDGGGSGTVVTVTDVGASTAIEGLTIRNGFNSYAGGGLRLFASALAITDCVIENNTAAAAGGIYSDGASTPTVSRCIIRNNHAPFGSGGGVYADHSGGGTYSHCLIYGNTCAAFGGGITAWEDAGPSVDHCTIVENGAALAGGNMYFTRGGALSVSNSIVAMPTQGANVEAQADPGVSTFSCSDLFVYSGANVVGFDSPIGTAGSFSADPLFCNAAVGDLGVFSNSPCASANGGACQLVGAIDAQCGAVPTTQSSWGQLKSRYR